MKMNHNKKRNVGIIYELLVRAVSAYLIEDKKNKAQQALDILSKHYNQNTELYKEFRLFNALAKSTVKDSAVAAAIINESKSAVKRFNHDKLIKEKSSLIRDINHQLVDVDFYYRKVPDYRIFASIQSTINEWSQGDRSNLTETVILESRLIEWLTSDKKDDDMIEEGNKQDVDTLVVKIMNEKFNEKYNDKLTLEQKTLIRDYVFSMQNDDGIMIREKARKIVKESLTSLEALRKSEKDKFVLEKAAIVESKIKSLDFESVDDDKISKLMTLTQMINEIKES